MMTTFALMTCCEMLSIDPKTLRNWLRQAQMPLHVHPTDARIKCLTMEQVQRLATLHSRALKPDVPFLPQLPEPIARREAEPLAQWEWEASSVQGQKEPIALQDETAWLKQIAHLEAQMASLQQQLASLRSLGPVQQAAEQGHVQADRKISRVDGMTDGRRHRVWKPHPAESRRRPVLSLIAYGATGNYVVICPLQGELSLEPDSAQWFAWLASLSSFRFVGKLGRLSASRTYDHGPMRTWFAYRTIHQHDYKHYLGTTDHLTIDVLEQMAARFQSYVDAF